MVGLTTGPGGPPYFHSPPAAGQSRKKNTPALPVVTWAHSNQRAWQLPGSPCTSLVAPVWIHLHTSRAPLSAESSTRLPESLPIWGRPAPSWPACTLSRLLGPIPSHFCSESLFLNLEEADRPTGNRDLITNTLALLLSVHSTSNSGVVNRDFSHSHSVLSIHDTRLSQALCLFLTVQQASKQASTHIFTRTHTPSVVLLDLQPV